MTYSPSPGTVNVLPSGDKVVPAGGFVKTTDVGSKVPSKSESLVSGSKVKGVSSVTVMGSSVATGGLLILR